MNKFQDKVTILNFLTCAKIRRIRLNTRGQQNCPYFYKKNSSFAPRVFGHDIE